MAGPPNEMGVFQRVIDRGSFAAAAGDIGLSPSAVSKPITRLELRLGVRLINRTTRRLALTHEGEMYLDRARHILRAIESAEAEIAVTRTSPRGQLRVHAFPTFAVDHGARAAGFSGALSPYHIRFSGHEPVGRSDCRQHRRRA